MRAASATFCPSSPGRAPGLLRPKGLVEAPGSGRRAVPIAVLANMARHHRHRPDCHALGGSEAARASSTGFSGWLVFMACAGLYVLLNLLLHRLPGTGGRRNLQNRLPSSSRGHLARRAHRFMVVLLTAPAVAYLGEVPVRPLRQPLAESPRPFTGGPEKPVLMDPKVWRKWAARTM